jgi:hypothetical protein
MLQKQPLNPLSPLANVVGGLRPHRLRQLAAEHGLQLLGVARVQDDEQRMHVGVLLVEGHEAVRQLTGLKAMFPTISHWHTQTYMPNVGLSPQE